MPSPSYLELTAVNSIARRIAYHKTAAGGEGETQPGVVFLGGFKSDMEGSKALHLEAWAKATGRQFLRFDYRGHGQSSDEFENGCIGDWADDAVEAISRLTTGPQILIGSSMGGWISLLVSRVLRPRIAAFIGIAAAPDFTEGGMWAEMSEAERETLMEEGRIERPSEYSDEPYVFTKKLIEDGRDHLVLRSPVSFAGPVRLLQGTADADVSTETALRLLDHIEGPDVRLTLVQGADHRFSGERELALLIETVEAVS